MNWMKWWPTIGGAFLSYCNKPCTYIVCRHIKMITVCKWLTWVIIKRNPSRAWEIMISFHFILRKKKYLCKTKTRCFVFLLWPKSEALIHCGRKYELWQLSELPFSKLFTKNIPNCANAVWKVADIFDCSSCRRHSYRVELQLDPVKTVAVFAEHTAPCALCSG